MGNLVWNGLLGVSGPSDIGAGTATGVTRTTLASDDPAVTALATANAALAVANLVRRGLTANVTVTRPGDTTTYSAVDVLGPAAGTSALDFDLGAISGSSILITSVSLERDVTAIISGETTYALYLYSVTPPSALADNITFDIPAGDRASFLGKIAISQIVDEVSTLYIEMNNIGKQVKLAGTHIFGYLVTVGTYAPASASVLKITLHAQQL